ncbi:MAG: recombinase family protein [Rhodobacteraceae bacterium]|nr:recombinase family protein [Paracoccaceae bacterium]
MTSSLAIHQDDTPQRAVIYCRVSSAKQKASGAGLESQQHRCRQYADARGYTVAAVFPDDISGGGDFMKRPGMVALLSFIDAQPDENFVVIFDDLKRFARDTEFHIKLRREFDLRGAQMECLNFKFEDTPEGKFVETIVAAQGELEREQNRRQTIQKMKARVEKGYYINNKPPRGYVYEKRRGDGKVIVRNEPIASILQEAFEGYASGRFQTQVEVKRFLESHPTYPKDLPDGTIRNQRIKDILTNPTYAGCVQAPGWGVSLRDGVHDGLISLAAFERIQERLNGIARAPIRKDINEDFPLRGFVLCDDCQKPMTACWSTSKSGKKHPYYWCKTKTCERHRKSIPRQKLEGAFEVRLRKLQPSANLAALAKDMFTDLWDMRHARAELERKTLEAQAAKIDKDIEALVDRLIETASPSVSQRIEARVSQLEREKLLIAEQIEKPLPNSGTAAELFEHALLFLANPWKIWEKGSLQVRRMVLRLVFAEPISYSPEQGVRTPKTTIPFRYLGGLGGEKMGMARWGGFEPPTP